MKFVRLTLDGELTEVTYQPIPVLYNPTQNSIKIRGVNHSINLRDIKNSWNYLREEWFGGRMAVREGVFWTAFLTYIFPWFLDIAKVYCAIMVCQAFYKEHRGSGNGDGKSGMQALVHYGKWYLIFCLIPFAVELIDQIGIKMKSDISKGGFPNNVYSGE
jgi:hypothetical protein